MDRILHIYGQGAWHEEADIVGDRAALTALRDAIDRALSEGSASTDAMVTDGEGFPVVVIRLDDAETLARLPLPYSDEMAYRPGTITTVDLVGRDRYLALLRPEDA